MSTHAYSYVYTFKLVAEQVEYSVSNQQLTKEL